MMILPCRISPDGKSFVAGAWASAALAPAASMAREQETARNDRMAFMNCFAMGLVPRGQFQA
jgi:hypothetical protein